LALKISRLALLISLLTCIGLLVAAKLNMIDPGAALGFGAWSGVAIFLSAAACVFFQGLSFKPRSRSGSFD
jgi:hypothetical protein